MIFSHSDRVCKKSFFLENIYNLKTFFQWIFAECDDEWDGRRGGEWDGRRDMNKCWTIKHKQTNIWRRNKNIFNYLLHKWVIYTFGVLCFMFVYCLITYWHSQWVIENVIILNNIEFVSKIEEISNVFSNWFLLSSNIRPFSLCVQWQKMQRCEHKLNKI